MKIQPGHVISRDQALDRQKVLFVCLVKGSQVSEDLFSGGARGKGFLGNGRKVWLNFGRQEEVWRLRHFYVHRERLDEQWI